MVQLDLEEHTTLKKQYTCGMMIMWWQWDFNEQIEKLVRFLLCTRGKCSRKIQDWVHFVPSQ
jgi:hypothetical protein